MVAGLLVKLWVSDQVTERWGAIYLFESQEASEQPLASRAHELIGKEPDLFDVFDLEPLSPSRLSSRALGLAFT